MSLSLYGYVYMSGCVIFHDTSSVTNMLTELKWPQLQLRRTRTRLIFFYNIIRNLLQVYLAALRWTISSLLMIDLV
jgi:hypothetical protein